MGVGCTLRDTAPVVQIRTGMSDLHTYRPPAQPRRKPVQSGPGDYRRRTQMGLRGGGDGDAGGLGQVMGECQIAQMLGIELR